MGERALCFYRPGKLRLEIRERERLKSMNGIFAAATLGLDWMD